MIRPPSRRFYFQTSAINFGKVYFNNSPLIWRLRQHNKVALVDATIDLSGKFGDSAVILDNGFGAYYRTKAGTPNCIKAAELN